MPEKIIQSALLTKVPGLRHGFLANHTPGGRDALDREEPSIATVKQVHGDVLLWTDKAEQRQREADALATCKPGLKVGVYSADCTPILVAALEERGAPQAVMAVHAGWRGSAARIAEKSLEAFAQRTAARRFIAAIGPCISYESFEVGEEVVAAFPGSRERGLARFLRQEGGREKFLLDLPGENARQLRETAGRLGLHLEMETLPLCTFRLKESLPSYRRDGTQAGRILSYLVFEG
jgi:YfiH family protein